MYLLLGDSIVEPIYFEYIGEHHQSSNNWGSGNQIDAEGNQIFDEHQLFLQQDSALLLYIMV